MIALFAPLLELVAVVVNAVRIRVELIGPAKRIQFARMHSVGGAAAGDLAFADVILNHRRVAVFVYADFVDSGTQHGESEIGRIHFEILVVAEPLHAQAQRTRGELHLRDVVGQIEKGEVRILRERDGGRADMQSRARALVCPQSVARRE